MDNLLSLIILFIYELRNEFLWLKQQVSKNNYKIINNIMGN